VTTIRGLAIGFLALGLVLGAGAGGSQAEASSHQLALGVSSMPWDSLADVDAFSASVQRSPATWSIWSTWGGKDAAFPDRSFMNGLRSRHIVPLVFWQPADPGDNSTNPFTYFAIAHGDFDAYIRAWATAAKAYAGPVIVRFAPEMDGSWFPWSVSRFGNTPQRFVKAWRHIWLIFHSVGATNVRLLWSPAQPCSCRSDLYPGDAYVDYVGFTAYNWANASHPWRGLGSIVHGKMKSLVKLTRKPVIIAELGSSAVGGDKATWIKRGYNVVLSDYPQITAIVYFDVDMTRHGQPDWRLQVPQGALYAYKHLLTHPQFRGSLE
jgi:hypothetical protein